MGAVYDMARVTGCVCLETIAWLQGRGDDPVAAWSLCDRGDWIAFALVRLGFPLARVVKVVLEPATDVPWIRQKLNAELALLTKYDDSMAPATSALTVFRLFSIYTGISQSDLADAIRAEFSWDEVLDTLVAAINQPQETT